MAKEVIKTTESGINPLLYALKENDKKHLFQSNIISYYHKTGFHLYDYYFGTVANVHDENGNIIRQEPRVGQAAGTFNLFIGNSGSGKQQPDSTPIPTPYGWKTLGDLKIGDEVFTDTGETTTVDGVFPHGEQDVYKITFSDGRTALCGADHLWEVYTLVNGRYTRSVIDTLTMLKDYKDFNDETCTSRKYKIPALRGYIQYPHQDIDTDPYKVGTSIAVGIFEDDYLSILHKYIHNDYEIRIELLRGLMDAAGVISDENGKLDVMYLSDSAKEISSILELIRSLGYNSVVDGNNEPGEEYHGTILFQVPNSFKKKMFCMKYKSLLDKIDDTDDDFYKYITIEEIKFSHRESSRCIHVTSPSHLYVTDQFIVTHNTTMASQIAANIIRQYKYANVIHFDCENRFDTSRCETITKLPSTFFNAEKGERYMIRTGKVSLEEIQEMIVKTYVSKMKLKDQLFIKSGVTDEFGKDVYIYEPTVIIIDSITTVLNETFNPDSAKEAADAEKMRGNTEGARDAKSLKGFFKDILPLCKEANIIVFGINHINQNMSMNAFLPVAKQQNYLKQDESIPGGKTMIYYPFNIVKLTAKPSDDFTEEADGFAGHIVMIEPIKSSSNQSGNNSKGVSFEMVFSHKYGFDSLRSILNYGREYGLIDGNKTRMKFRDDPSFTFSMKALNKEKNEKPIWECVAKYIVPQLNVHLPFVNTEEITFDDREFNY